MPVNPSDVRWWNQNGMSQYGQYDSRNNTIRLKEDVHQLFDHKPCFAIVPKNGTLVAHIFRACDDSAEAVRLYHNVPLQFMEEARTEFLLARLAWTVFRYLEVFLCSMRRRKVSRIGEDGVRIVEEMDGDKWCRLYAQSTPRSTSPRKRNIRQVEPTLQEHEGGRSEDELATESYDEWPLRGRKRRRSSIWTYPERTFPSNSTAGRLQISSSEVSASQDALVLAHLQTGEV